MLDPRSVQLLHVEDDDLCLMGLHRAFRAAKLANPISFAHNGIDALEILRGTNGRVRLPRPFVILLDLKMPRMGGIEFLQELRRDDDLKKSVVFIMTTSGADEDNVKAYNLGVAGYILKPIRRTHSWKQRRCWTPTGEWSNFPLAESGVQGAAQLMNSGQSSMLRRVMSRPCAALWVAPSLRIKTRPYVTFFSVTRAHTDTSSHGKERAMNIPNEVKPWHKAAPMLITAATILGLIVIFHR